jgi:hypothetical protein
VSFGVGKKGPYCILDVMSAAKVEKPVRAAA